MNDNEKLRRSIDATLREIQIAHLALSVPIEPMDFIEAMQIIERIEARHKQAQEKRDGEKLYQG